jgi:hypothetical protein
MQWERRYHAFITQSAWFNGQLDNGVTIKLYPSEIA